MQAEKAFLGTIIKHNYLIKDTTIKTEYLQEERHRALYETILSLTEKGKNVDVITLSIVPNLEVIGGISYINELISFADEKKFYEFEELVRESWKEREKNEILAKALNQGWDIQKVTSELDKLNDVKVDDHSSIDDLLADVYEAPWSEQEVQKGATTGIMRLNKMTNGLQNSEVMIIAARPSMGKSDFMLHLVKQVGWQGYLPVVFSLEMPDTQIRNRLIASTGHINREKFRNLNKYLTDQQKAQWPNVVARVSETKMQIFDQAGQTIAEMRAKIRKMIHKFKDRKPVVFIDYLTLIKPRNFYNGSAHLQTTEMSKDLKSLAKEFDCPVVCLAQLNRSVEQRSDKRPMMSDIRESGSVEQDADTIIFLYRDKYYNKESNDDTLELIVAKNRNGPVGVVNVKYNEHTGEIIDIS